VNRHLEHVYATNVSLGLAAELKYWDGKTVAHLKECAHRCVMVMDTAIPPLESAPAR